MKLRLTLLLSLILTCALHAQLIGVAPGQAGSFYFHGDIGPAMYEDTGLDEFLFPLSGVDVEFDTGVRFDLGGGYQVTDWFAAEMETGFSVAYVDKFKGLGTLSTRDSSFSTVPLFINAVFQLPTEIGLIPYAGLGGGVTFTSFDADDINGTIGGTRVLVDGSESDAVLGYQGFAGLRYEFLERMEVGVGYKYHWSDSSSYDVDTYFTPGIGDIEIDSVVVHSVSFNFRMRF